MNVLPLLALALAGITLITLVVAVVLLWRAAQRASAHLAILQAQVTRLLEAQQAVDARLEALAALVREERAHASLPPTVTGRAYELAAHLASSGSGPERLIAQCGLTPAEAALAIRIHGLGARTRAAGEW
jgi:hypothetical protein